MSNYQSSFHVIDLKIDIEPSLVYCRRSACILQRPAAARCAVELRDKCAQAADGAYRVGI